MVSDKKLEKKKASTANELIRGTGLLLLLSPIIFFGFAGSFMLMVVATGGGLLGGLVAGIPFFIMVFFLMRFVMRFQLLRRWIRGLREEYYRLSEIRPQTEQSASQISPTLVMDEPKAQTQNLR